MNQKEAYSYLKAIFNHAQLDRYREALQIALNALHPRSKWIPCSDKLPERFQKVIVCRKIEKGVYLVEQGYKDVGDWWKVYGTRTKKVTHWMSMPLPPEEESHGLH